MLEDRKAEKQHLTQKLNTKFGDRMTPQEITARGVITEDEMKLALFFYFFLFLFFFLFVLFSFRCLVFMYFGSAHTRGAKTKTDKKNTTDKKKPQIKR